MDSMKRSTLFIHGFEQGIAISSQTGMMMRAFSPKTEDKRSIVWR